MSLYSLTGNRRENNTNKSHQMRYSTHIQKPAVLSRPSINYCTSCYPFYRREFLFISNFIDYWGRNIIVLLYQIQQMEL